MKKKYEKAEIKLKLLIDDVFMTSIEEYDNIGYLD